MNNNFYIIIFLIFLSPPFYVFGANDLSGKQYLCSKLLWGFEFISPEKVNVISTDINKKTNVKEYYYEKDLELSFINLYLNQENNKNIAFSIHDRTLRVDIWAMTSGGNTLREIIPEYFCEEVQINNMIDYIESLKQ